MELILLPERYAVCRLDAHADAPGWGVGAGLWSLTRTADELSLVCAEDGLPADTGRATVDPGWRCMRVAGSMDLGLVGVMAGLSSALAGAGVAIFVIATYNTDYLLVRGGDLERATSALRAAGYAVAG
jgi:hypothetical protein